MLATQVEGMTQLLEGLAKLGADADWNQLSAA
jgi:hypothetical protein